MVPGEVFPEAGKCQTMAILRYNNSLILQIINVENNTNYQYIKTEHKTEKQSKPPTCIWGGLRAASGTATCYCSRLDLESACSWLGSAPPAFKDKPYVTQMPTPEPATQACSRVEKEQVF